MGVDNNWGGGSKVTSQIVLLKLKTILLHIKPYYTVEGRGAI